MSPFLYHYDPLTRRATNLGALFPLQGDCYWTFASRYPPFDGDHPWPTWLSLPGKIMAYIAFGRPCERAIEALERLLHAATAEVFGNAPPVHERAVLRSLKVHIRDHLSVPDVSAPDMLASIHTFLGRTLVSRLLDRIERDGRRTANLCLVGGCALNIRWNRDIRASGVADRMWVPPFPNDAGSALGTACCHMLKNGGPNYLDWNVYAGPSLVPGAILDGWSGRQCSIPDLATWLHATGEPVLFLDGRAELGPRALGHRSILAAAVDPAMKDRLNQIKGRESYRPVAPICLEHRAPDVFSPGTPDPYMLFDHEVRDAWSSRVPAIRHLDGSARLQTVNQGDDPKMFELLTSYEALSGIPLLCNTSANRKGCGFFPDLRSAMDWGHIPALWSDGVLYERG